MFSKHFYPILVLGVYLFIGGCDPTTSPKKLTDDVPSVREAFISPATVEFQPSDGFKDTTLSIFISANIDNFELATSVGFVVRDKETETIFTEGELQETIAGLFRFAGSFEIETSTTSYEEYSVEVYAYDEIARGNYYQTLVSVEGLSNNPPEIIEVNHPSEVQRPTSGSTQAIFEAKVTDLDGQESIEQVFVRIIQEGSEEPVNNFLMIDDGTNGDNIASDSVYTRVFPIPGRDGIDQFFTLKFFAIDKGGLVSDTVTTSFTILGNQ